MADNLLQVGKSWGLRSVGFHAKVTVVESWHSEGMEGLKFKDSEGNAKA